MFNAVPLFPTILLSIHVAVALQITPSLTPPPSIARTSATYDWCDCRTGASYITIYPTHNKTNAVQINTILAKAEIKGREAWVRLLSRILGEGDEL